MTEPSAGVYVVTVVHNRRETTVQFAERLSKQTIPHLVLVLVDDGSSDGTAEAVQAILPSTVVLRGDGNLWWAGGLQKGLNWLAGQGLDPSAIVAFSNDDVSFDDGYIQSAVTELRSLGLRAFLVAPGNFQPSGRISLEAGIVDWSRYRYLPFGDRPEQVNYSSTRSLFMTWGDLRRVGGFHPTLLPHYTSDFEFTIRAKKKGIRLVPAKTVAATFFEELTGDHSTRGLSLARKVRLLSSPRFSFNPLHHVVFIWYAAPWYWKPLCWARVLWSTLKFLR